MAIAGFAGRGTGGAPGTGAIRKFRDSRARPRAGGAPALRAMIAALGAPVVPIALNSGAVWGRGVFGKRPGRIVLRVLAPIPPGLPRAAFTALLEERIETASAELAGD